MSLLRRSVSSDMEEIFPDRVMGIHLSILSEEIQGGTFKGGCPILVSASLSGCSFPDGDFPSYHIEYLVCFSIHHSWYSSSLHST